MRKVILKNIVKHPSLAKIVALDTYLGNMDRSLPNVFYDFENNAFYGIDMGNSFKGNLALEAYLSVKEFGTTLDKSVLAGLANFNKTLKVLIKEFPPQVLTSILDKIVFEIWGSSNFDEGAAQKLKSSKAQKNYKIY